MRLAVSISTDPSTGGFTNEYPSVQEAIDGLTAYLRELKIHEDKLQKTAAKDSDARSEH